MIYNTFCLSVTAHKYFFINIFISGKNLSLMLCNVYRILMSYNKEKLWNITNEYVCNVIIIPV